MLVGFILILKNEAIGIYDNEEILNNFINGCLQNNFFNKDDIKIKKYNINSINCLPSLAKVDICRQIFPTSVNNCAKYSIFCIRQRSCH